MLVEFSGENFRSFRDRITLSFVPAGADKSKPENLILGAQSTKLDLLRSVAIYGPNASGKSNLLKALDYMTSFVLHSADTKTKTGVSPFRLSVEFVRKPSTFEIVLIHRSVRYVYGFTIDAERVYEEWLHSYPRNQQRVLFHRTINEESGKQNFHFGSYWEGPKKQLIELTRPDALFLTVATQFNSQTAKTVFEWFAEKFRSVSWFPVGGPERTFTCVATHTISGLKEKILKYCAKADPGISNVEINEMAFEDTPEWSGLPEPLRQELAKEIKEARAFEVQTFHRGFDTSGASTSVIFGLSEESDGTQKMFALAGPWQYILDNGCFVTVDELDARLHPLLTRWLIQLFHNASTNPKGAQLLFATHDAGLLDRPRAFRRDQVWFTDKTPDGASTLYSLWDFEKPPRRDENFRLGYLAGRYGAVPFTESIADITEPVVK